jgi:hypothetical protein
MITITPRHQADFKAYALCYGLKPTDLGRCFAHDGLTYIIVGAIARAGRPIIGERVGSTDPNLRYFCFSTHDVVHAGVNRNGFTRDEIAALDNVALSAIATSTNPSGRFWPDREMAHAELARRGYLAAHRCA